MKRLLGFVLVVVLAFVVMGLTSPGLIDRTKLGLDLKGGFEILYEASPLIEGGQVTKESLNQTAKSLQDRVNATGVSEPEVTTEGKDRIRVKIAGVTDEAAVREMLKRPA